MSRRGLLAAGLFALSLLVHAKGLRAPLLDYHFHRQVNTAAIARNYARENRPIHRPRIDWEGPEDRLAGSEMPLYMWLYGKLWNVGGLGEGWGRLISALCSAACAVLLFGLYEGEFGLEAAAWGAAVFTVLPVEIYFGRTVQPEGFALLALVGALVAWEKSLRPGRPWGWWALAVLCAFVAVGEKLPYAHVLIPLAGLTWRRLGKKTLTDGRLYAAGLVSMGAVLAWYAWARTGVYVVPTKAVEYDKLLAWSRLPYFMQFQVLSRWPEVVMTYAGVALFFVGASEVLWKKRELFWLSWFGGVALHLFAMGGYAHYHEYTSLPLAPVAAGLIGLGIARLREKASRVAAPKRPLAYAGLALLVAAIPAHAALRIGHWYKQGYGFTARAGEAAAAVSARDDLFFTNCQASSVLLYYLDRRGWSNELDVVPREAAGLVDEAAAKGARFVASEKRGLFAEPDGALWRRYRAEGPPAWDDGALVIFRIKE